MNDSKDAIIFLICGIPTAAKSHFQQVRLRKGAQNLEVSSTKAEGQYTFCST